MGNFHRPIVYWQANLVHKDSTSKKNVIDRKWQGRKWHCFRWGAGPGVSAKLTHPKTFLKCQKVTQNDCCHWPLTPACPRLITECPLSTVTVMTYFTSVKRSNSMMHHKRNNIHAQPIPLTRRQQPSTRLRRHNLWQSVTYTECRYVSVDKNITIYTDCVSDSMHETTFYNEHFTNNNISSSLPVYCKYLS